MRGENWASTWYASSWSLRGSRLPGRACDYIRRQWRWRKIQQCIHTSWRPSIGFVVGWNTYTFDYILIMWRNLLILQIYNISSKSAIFNNWGLEQNKDRLFRDQRDVAWRDQFNGVRSEDPLGFKVLPLVWGCKMSFVCESGMWTTKWLHTDCLYVAESCSKSNYQRNNWSANYVKIRKVKFWVNVPSTSISQLQT